MPLRLGYQHRGDQKLEGIASLSCSHKKQPSKAVRQLEQQIRHAEDLPIRQSEGASVEGNVTSIGSQAERFQGNDRVLFGIILGVIILALRPDHAEHRP